MNLLMKKVLATAALLAIAATAQVQAKETVVWWDFLSGGDGVRMKKLIEDFNAEHKDTIEIQATTLEWGVPFYTKVQTSAAIGQGPDVMTYHLSRVPISVENGSLSEITDADLKTMGLSEADYPTDSWAKAHVDGKLYAVPFDVHPFVLYYNKDILAKNGLIGDNGLPKGLDGLDNFSAILKKIQAGGTKWGLSVYSSNGDFAQRWVYGFLKQQDGELLSANGKWLEGDNLDKLAKAVNVVRDWIKEGVTPGNTDYPAALALFTSGEAAFHMNGVWEVPTMTDLAKQGKLGFEWGAIEIPTLFNHPGTYADSHSFAIPNNVGKPPSPEKRAAVLEVISWMAKHSLFWATAGHIPAYKPVTDSAEYKAMQPQATYAVVTKNIVYDAPSKFAGVASPVSEAAGNDFTPAINGEMDTLEAVTAFRDTLNGLQ